MNIWDAVFGASKIVYKPGGTAYVTHISLLGRRKVGRGRKGKSSSLLTLSPNGLPLRRHVGMCHPKLRGGVCFLRRFGLKTGIDFVTILV